MAPAIFLALVMPLAARYQLCNFSCPQNEEQWVACRSEKCTPRLPEDACADGNEALLLPAFGLGEAAADDKAAAAAVTDGFPVSGPQECESLLAERTAPPAGSFQERCELCMGVVGEAVKIVRLALSGEGAATLQSGEPATVCDEALARIEATLPTVRTCRLHPPACAALLAAVRERACPQTYEQLLEATSASSLRAAQQSLCGEMMSQRNGSGVDDALVCPVPRDIGARVMAISAVVATCLFVAQWFRL